MGLAKFLVAMPRSRKIVAILQKKYNFDVSEDFETIKLILKFIGVNTLSNEEIAKEIMEIHTINVEDLYPTKR